MFITLVFFECIFAGMIILTTQMIEHKFHIIRTGLLLNGSKRNYKTHENIAFIEKVISEYINIEDENYQENDLVYIIRKDLEQEQIGRFSFVGVMNLATRLVTLMYAVLGLEALVIWINDMKVNEIRTIILLIVSFSLSMGMFFYKMMKGLERKEEILIGEVINYVEYIYPKEKYKPLKKRVVAVQEESIQTINQNERIIANKSNDSSAESQEINEDEKDDHNLKKVELNAKDIASLLQRL